MALVETFLLSPSEELLNSCTRDQLLQLVQHYNVDIGEVKLKEEIKLCLRSVLVNEGVLPGKDGSVSKSDISLTFEQKRELLYLEMEKEKMAMEQLKLALERERVQLEQDRLRRDSSESVGQRREFDLVSNLRLVPKFDESDPDTFFSLFERVANSRGWPDSERVVMLQSVFTGKAQAAYSALGERESKVYRTVKEAVLKAYELVPEAYRQRFRSWRKANRQSNVEFARDLTKHFNRWCSALEVTSFERLCDVIVLEQFIDCVPPEVATHIIERGISTVSDAATVADEYILAHKGKSRRDYHTGFAAVRSSRFSTFEFPKTNHFSKSGNYNSMCNYCHERGHWKSECPWFEKRRWSLRS